jgi:haloacetate dehalogenase
MASRTGLEDFTAEDIDTGETTIFVRRAGAGAGAPVLLLHGFPETHVMWRGIAPVLARDRAVVCADLRGYGRSGCPESAPDHAPYAKRSMARDLVVVMEQLGCPRFAVVGHDRGARVASRLALDHPARVDRLAVLDIVPAEDAWQRADARFATTFWPWSLLAQPAPLPERLLAAAPEAIIDDAITAWGTPVASFPADVRAAYADALRDPAHARAICEEYRAAATIDREHDRSDRAAGRGIACPVLALGARDAALDAWYAADGGPLGLWRGWADRVEGHAVSGGHFFPEHEPAATAATLLSFLQN